MTEHQGEDNSSAPELLFRRADERGRTRLGWLDSKHSFSFGQYQDVRFQQFGPLRVINDDIVAPGGGFGEHGHADMEILTWVLSGTLKHGDSLGNLRDLSPGELQVMTAGAGIRHSELNASQSEPVHFLQVWLLPREKGLKPSYKQVEFEAAGRENQWQQIASGGTLPSSVDTNRSGMPIAADAEVFVADLSPGQNLRWQILNRRKSYLHLIAGEVGIDHHAMRSGDAAMITSPGMLELTAMSQSSAMLFDMPI